MRRQTRGDPFNVEGDPGTKNYNRKEVLWKTENLTITAFEICYLSCAPGSGTAAGSQAVFCASCALTESQHFVRSNAGAAPVENTLRRCFVTGKIP
jgi:hypothetical protein